MSFNYMQPFVTLAGGLQTQNAAVGATEFNSMYESFNELTTVNKQHFVEWFSGSALDSIWTFTNVAGSGSGAMSDSVDGGYEITTGTSSGNESQIHFNDKRQYAHDGSVLIGITKRDDSSSAQNKTGFTTNGGTDTVTDRVYVENGAGQTYYRLFSGDASSASGLESSIAVDTSWHIHKITTSSSNLTLHIDGVLEVTKTTNRPTVKQQPFFQGETQAAAAKTHKIRYLECYNT